MKTLVTCLLLICISPLAFSQGCSDAGFCTMGAMRPDQNFSRETKFKLRSLGIQYYRGQTTLSPVIDAITLDFNFTVKQKYGIQVKLPYQYVEGTFGSNHGFGDISLSVTRDLISKPNWDLKGSIGFKIPTGNSRDQGENGLTLPMYYQTTLGSFDVVAGVSYLSKNWLFAVGYQQALTSNDNDFTYGEWVRFANKDYLHQYHVGVGLRRGTDIMFRAERNFRFSNYSFNLGLLPIYRITEDQGIIRTGEGDRVPRTTGLALSALAGVTYHLNVSNTFKLLYGYKITDRETNPDGLTRDWVFNATYEVRF